MATKNGIYVKVDVLMKLVEALSSGKHLMGHYDDCDDPEARFLSCFDIDASSATEWANSANINDVSVMWIA